MLVDELRTRARWSLIVSAKLVAYHRLVLRRYIVSRQAQYPSGITSCRIKPSQIHLDSSRPVCPVLMHKLYLTLGKFRHQTLIMCG